MAIPDVPAQRERQAEERHALQAAADVATPEAFQALRKLFLLHLEELTQLDGRPLSTRVGELMTQSLQGSQRVWCNMDGICRAAERLPSLQGVPKFVLMPLHFLLPTFARALGCVSPVFLYSWDVLHMNGHDLEDLFMICLSPMEMREPLTIADMREWQRQVATTIESPRLIGIPADLSMMMERLSQRIRAQVNSVIKP